MSFFDLDNFSGFWGWGAFGMGNVVKGPLFLNLGLRKEAYFGTYAITSFFTNIPKISIYAVDGNYPKNIFVVVLCFLGLSFLGTFLGKKILRKIDDVYFFWIINVVLILTCLWLVFG